ncbi:hypothetical protein J2129_000701 [Methanofollis sp. W23]|nr:hypothetical protein [Methanofollis sp. W23]
MPFFLFFRLCRIRHEPRVHAYEMNMIVGLRVVHWPVYLLSGQTPRGTTGWPPPTLLVVRGIQEAAPLSDAPSSHTRQGRMPP